MPINKYSSLPTLLYTKKPFSFPSTILIISSFHHSLLFLVLISNIFRNYYNYLFKSPLFLPSPSHTSSLTSTSTYLHFQSYTFLIYSFIFNADFSILFFLKLLPQVSYLATTKKRFEIPNLAFLLIQSNLITHINL